MYVLRRWLIKTSLALVFMAHHARRLVRRLQGLPGVHSVRVLLVRDDRVLLVRHWYAPGILMLPGGGLAKGESPADAARREIQEETGFELEELELLGEYHGNYKGDVVTVFIATKFRGFVRLVPNHEIMLRSFKSLKDIEDLEEIAPDSKRRIRAFNANVRGERGTW